MTADARPGVHDRGEATAPPERLVGRNFLVLGSGEVFARLIAFAGTIYVARTLGAEYYGIIGFATAIVLYLSRIADAGMELGIGVREVAADPAGLQAFVPSILTARVLIAALLAAGLGVVAVLAFPDPEGPVIALYGLTLLAVGASSRWVYLGLERASLVAAVRTGGETVVVLLILALVRGPADLTRVPIAQFSGEAVAAAVLLGWLAARRFRLRPRLDTAVLRRLLPRSAPMVGASLVGLMIYNSDLLFLRAFDGIAAVGYYAAAYTLISFLSNVGSTYGLSLLPTLTRLDRAPEHQHDLYQSATAQVFAVTLPIAIGGALLAPAVIELIFGDGYRPAGGALRILVWAVPVSVLRDVAIAGLMARSREDRILRLTAGAAALNLVLNLLLIPRYSMTGAAIATVATESLRMAAAFAFARLDGFRPIAPGRLWKPAIAAAAMAALLLALRPTLATAIPLSIAAWALTLILTGGIRLRRRGLPVLDL